MGLPAALCGTRRRDVPVPGLGNGACERETAGPAGEDRGSHQGRGSVVYSNLRTFRCIILTFGSGMSRNCIYFQMTRFAAFAEASSSLPSAFSKNLKQLIFMCLGKKKGPCEPGSLYCVHEEIGKRLLKCSQKCVIFPVNSHLDHSFGFTRV